MSPHSKSVSRDSSCQTGPSPKTFSGGTSTRQEKRGETARKWQCSFGHFTRYTCSTAL